MTPQKICCTVTNIVEHDEHVYSVFLSPERPLPRFLAGQFLHLALDDYRPEDFWPDSRVFSIASSPSDPILRITYAVKGAFTTRMETELCLDRKVWVKMPYGEFVIPNDRPICLLAGGTGITAFTAFVAGLQVAHADPVYLFYGAPSEKLLIYREQIELARTLCPDFHFWCFVEEQNPGTDFLKGRIDLDQVFERIPNAEKVHFYLSGPPVMLAMLSAGFGDKHFPVEQIHTDAWE